MEAEEIKVYKGHATKLRSNCGHEFIVICNNPASLKNVVGVIMPKLEFDSRMIRNVVVMSAAHVTSEGKAT